ncbi:hypothetical protein D6827_00405 [Candidatus Parcubacteria bacterium]|nr:MAG: hypothetical protein D6827_00405 [Candidatus Parcubacteria bacterium]
MTSYSDLIASVQKYNWTTDKLKQLFDLFLVNTAYADQTTLTTYSTSTYTTIGSLSHTVTVSNGDVIVLIANGRYSVNSTSTAGNIQLAKDGTQLMFRSLTDDSGTSTGYAAGWSMAYIDSISAGGTVTYTCDARRSSGSNVFYIAQADLTLIQFTAS